MTTPPMKEFLRPFGISADTGRPISDLSDEGVAAMLGTGRALESLALQERSNTADLSFAVIGDVDANDLTQSGWGVIFAPNVDQAVKDALKPLIDHRKAVARPFVIYDGAASVRPGESVRDWLGRQGV